MAVERRSARVAVVTGASRGIGRATALALARRGVTVVLVGRSTDERPNRAGLPGTLESVLLEVEAEGGNGLVLPADLSQLDEAQRIVAETLDQLGHCDVLVNNAALSFLGTFLEVPARRWNAVMAVNL